MNYEKNRSKDGSYNAHIYNQRNVQILKMMAQKSKKSMQKFINEIIEDYIQEHFEFKIK